MKKDVVVDFVASLLEENLETRYIDVSFEDVAELVVDKLQENEMMVPNRDTITLRAEWE